MHHQTRNPGAAQSTRADPLLRLRTIRKPGLVFMAAVLVRLVFFVTFFHTTPVQRAWGTGYEAGRIAASLVSGHGFGSPFDIPTGPSAWIPPAYTGVLALLFEVFGAYSVAAAWSALVLNALFAAATAVAIYAAGEKYVGAYIGVFAAWIWTFSPYEVIMSWKVWETSLSALLVITGSLLYWRLRDSEKLRDWGWWGFFWGSVMLVNPAVGIFFPVLSVGAGWRNRTQLAKRLVLATAVACVIVGPWIARNYVQFHTLFPIRSNFAEELWLGNHEGVLGPADEGRHPLGDPRELAAYRQLGERNYLIEKRRVAIAFIRNHPAEFARLTLWRVASFWSSPRGSLWLLISVVSFLGLALAMKKDFLQSLPFAVALLLYPGAYYLTHADNWYRHPIEPLMFLLLVYAIVSVSRRLLGRDRELTAS